MADATQPFQAFLDEHRARVHAFLRGLVGPVDAEDCLQETFLAALRAYPSFDGRNPRAWILTIARRKAIDSVRARGRRPQPLAEPEALADGAAPPAGMDAADAAIWEAVSALPGGQRAAVVLRFAVSLRYREIADTLGCSEPAARRRVSDALGALRAELNVREEE